MQKIHISSKQYSFFNLHGTFMNVLYTTLGKTLLLSTLLSIFSLCLSAQQRTKIILQSATYTHSDNKTNITYLRNPVFKQDNAILTCDSAVFYTNRNYFEAYRNVHINQADTINIYSDRLNYDGNLKLAHLTDKVILKDKTSTLTTNILDYNMVTKVATYVEGGKIINKDININSKNGYYFANTRDAYFRYNVVAVTEQSTIKSDTLRYNTLSNWAYFYGPTNIKEKDGGNLYTENGTYNTKTRYAYFGKNNLYTSESKSLKGDSLYYDGIAGYGKAVKNIVFKDTTDKMIMRGQLGYYYKTDQRTLVTRNAYAGMGTNDSIMVKDAKTHKDVKVQDTIWIGADTLETQMVRQGTLKLIKGPAIKKDNELGEEDRAGTSKGNSKSAKVSPATTKSGVPLTNEKTPPSGKLPDDKKKTKDDNKAVLPLGKDSLKKDGIPPVKIDSGLKVPPSLSKKADSVLKKDGTALKKDGPVIKKADSLLKAPGLLIKATDPASKKADTTLKKTALKISTDTAKTDSVKLKAAIKNGAIKPILKAGAKKTLKDSLPFNPADTILTRIIKAYHHVNVFKTDMQAKADSLFYTSADSTLRWYRNPIIWSQGSQQTGDTIYLQLRNKKINSVQVILNAFSVNVEADSARFNQIKGKLLTGFFKDGNLNSLFVDGNAESIYFTKTEDGKKYDKMNQTVSSRIKISFKNKDISKVVPIKDVEGATTPVADLEKDVFLTGFIWKPELRPRSKRDITNPKVAAKTVKPAVKTPAKDPKKNTKPGDLKTLISKIPVTPGTVSKLVKAADSLNLQKKIPVQLLPAKVTEKLTDTVQKSLPVLLKKGDSLLKKNDSLLKQHVPLKKQ